MQETWRVGPEWQGDRHADLAKLRALMDGATWGSGGDAVALGRDARMSVKHALRLVSNKMLGGLGLELSAQISHFHST